MIQILEMHESGSNAMPPEPEYGAQPRATGPSTTEPDVGRPPSGLAVTALAGGVIAVVALAFSILETVSIAVGVLALTAGGATWIRAHTDQTGLRITATIGMLLGIFALVTAISHVDKTIIPVDVRKLERRRTTPPDAPPDGLSDRPRRRGVSTVGRP